jgi:tetrahydromethanopterin S-methyltransferase subunit A
LGKKVKGIFKKEREVIKMGKREVEVKKTHKPGKGEPKHADIITPISGERAVIKERVTGTPYQTHSREVLTKGKKKGKVF